MCGANGPERNAKASVQAYFVASLHFGLSLFCTRCSNEVVTIVSGKNLICLDPANANGVAIRIQEMGERFFGLRNG